MFADLEKQHLTVWTHMQHADWSEELAKSRSPCGTN